jgi:hypothetical protein
MFFALPLTVSITIVADCVPLSCQVARKLKRATTPEFTHEPAIISYIIVQSVFIFIVIFLQ